MVVVEWAQRPNLNLTVPRSSERRSVRLQILPHPVGAKRLNDLLDEIWYVRLPCRMEALALATTPFT